MLMERVMGYGFGNFLLSGVFHLTLRLYFLYQPDFYAFLAQIVMHGWARLFGILGASGFDPLPVLYNWVKGG